MKISSRFLFLGTHHWKIAHNQLSISHVERRPRLDHFDRGHGLLAELFDELIGGLAQREVLIALTVPRLLSRVMMASFGAPQHAQMDRRVVEC